MGQTDLCSSGEICTGDICGGRAVVSSVAVLAAGRGHRVVDCIGEYEYPAAASHPNNSPA